MFIFLDNYELNDMRDDSRESIEFSPDQSIDDILEMVKEKSNINDDKLDELYSEIQSFGDGMEKKSFRIKHWVTNRSMSDLVEMFLSDEILIPTVQRSIIWTPQQCSRLIESIVLGIPIPPIFMAEIEDDKYEIIDGLQRLTAIKRFINGEPWNENFKRTASLSGDIISEIKGKKFSDLDLEIQTKIRRTSLPIIEFRQLSPDNLDVKYHIFERINSGAVKLSPMQIRKALIHGEFMTSVFEIYKTEDVIKNWANKKLTKNELHNNKLEELILKSLSMYLYVENKLDYIKVVRKFIDSGTQYMSKNMEEFHLEKYVNIFQNIILKSNEEYPELFENYKSYDNEYKYTGRINSNIFDALLALCIKRNVDLIDWRKLKNTIENEFKNPKNCFQYATNNEDVMKRRLDIIESCFLD